MTPSDIEQLIQLLAKLPGLGPRSGRRAALHLIKRKEGLLEPLIGRLKAVADNIQTCQICGNLDTQNPCSVCADPRRDPKLICVVADVADLWALERSSIFRGTYQVLGGVLSAIDGIGPDDLAIDQLVHRVQQSRQGPAEQAVEEVILGLDATLEGQTTAHLISDRLSETGVKVSGLAHGVPVGGELDYLDEGTLAQALKARTVIS